MDALLSAWFSRNERDLPWRQTRDPYAILVSEVMLQQTQVARVVPRYLRWLERWPTVEALAAAEAADVLREWQGLGYNRRALNLQRAARAVAAGGWPDDLTSLPGVGEYTAAAVRNFAFGDDVLPRDTNVRRVEERTGHTFGAAQRAGADGSRRDRVPRARAALRRVSAGGAVSVARPPLRAAPQAVAVRGVVPTAARARACARSSPAELRTTQTRSPRSRETASSASKATTSRCPRDALRPADRGAAPCRAAGAAGAAASSRRISRRSDCTRTA